MVDLQTTKTKDQRLDAEVVALARPITDLSKIKARCSKLEPGGVPAGIGEQFRFRYQGSVSSSGDMRGGWIYKVAGSRQCKGSSRPRVVRALAFGSLVGGFPSLCSVRDSGRIS